MSIEINIPPVLQALVGGVRQIDVSGSTVGECLAELVKHYPDLKPRIFTRRGRLIKGVSIFVNGKNAYPEPKVRPVREGDKIHIANIVLGG
jgi:molybdopterin converting factor small subunit